jgi:hypothetical protein
MRVAPATAALDSRELDRVKMGARSAVDRAKDESRRIAPSCGNQW